MCYPYIESATTLSDNIRSLQSEFGSIHTPVVVRRLTLKIITKTDSGILHAKKKKF